MLKLIAISVLSIGFQTAVAARGQASPLSKTELSADLDSFFVRMGFEDYSGHIKESLEKKRALNAIGVDTLKNNFRRYAMVNDARGLAVIILADAYPRLQDPVFRGKFLAFSVKFLALQPAAPPLEIPESVKDAGAAAVDLYLEKAARDNMRRQSAAIIADYAGIFYPGDKNFHRRKHPLPDLMSRYVTRIYLDPQIGNTQWLGRALMLGLARYSVVRYDKRLFKELSAEVEKQDLFIENYVGSTLVLGGKDVHRRVKIETGDLIFERSRHMKESAAITAAALPQDEGTAARLGLLGSFSDAIWDVSQEARAMGLSRFQRRKIIIAQGERFSNGMSHVAQLAVYRDKLTGIEQTLIWDDYPYSVHLNIDKDEEWGGIRLNGFEHFANPGEVMRVGVATMDKEKLFRMAQSNLAAKRARKWGKYAWESFVPLINGDREIVPQAKPVRHDWEYQISRDEFIALHDIADRKEWLRKYQEAVLKGWKIMLTEWGIWFNWIDAGAGLDGDRHYQSGRYWYGGMYCSEAVNSASLLFTGLSLEERPSHYASFLSWAQRAGIGKARQLDLKSRIIAPSSLALQPYSNPLIQVVYPPYSLTTLALYSYKIQTTPPDPNDEKLISKEVFRGPFDKGEAEALVSRERKFIEYVNLDKGRSLGQIFGKGREIKKTAQAWSSRPR